MMPIYSWIKLIIWIAIPAILSIFSGSVAMFLIVRYLYPIAEAQEKFPRLGDLIAMVVTIALLFYLAYLFRDAPL